MLTDWELLTRVLYNRADTLWWFGKEYHEKYGQVWPHDGEQPPKGYFYPGRPDGVIWALVLAVVITIIRYSFERLVADPLGKWFGLKHHLSGKPAGRNKKLETFIKKNKKPTKEQMKVAALEADMEVKQVETWVRRKQRELYPSKLNKFKESSWRCLFYTGAFSYGLHTLIHEDFVYNFNLTYVDFPVGTWAHKNSLYYYYLLEGGFYLSLMVSQLFDTKRKDFWEMFLHHIVTLSLIMGSYWSGNCRLGAVIMALHDVSDIFLEGAKMCVYTGLHKCSAVLIGGFAISFFVARLVYFPYMIYWFVTEAIDLVKVWPYHTVDTCFLCVLQVLHIYWFTFIMKLLIKVLVKGDDHKKSSDERSDEEPLASSEDETK